MIDIDSNKSSSIISLAVAIIVLMVNYLQWWNITYDGGMIMKFWVKILFIILILFLMFALFLLL